jgi:hypothetical protein
MIRENVLKALDIMEALVKRERKKRDMVVRRRGGRACLLGECGWGRREGHGGEVQGLPGSTV